MTRRRDRRELLAFLPPEAVPGRGKTQLQTDTVFSDTATAVPDMIPAILPKSKSNRRKRSTVERTAKKARTDSLRLHDRGAVGLQGPSFLDTLQLLQRIKGHDDS